MNTLAHRWNRATTALQKLDFIPLLALRLYLAPIMIISGWNKYQSFDNIVAWFGNPDWGLGLPFPTLLAFLATAAELVGGWLLVFGLFTRLTSFALMITMAIAAATVHWQHGWFAIAPSDPATSPATVLNWLNIPGSQASLENSAAVAQKLDMARSILQQHGNYNWLTEAGNYVILNNGIEFAATYFIMLLVLFIYGAGRYLSVDYWLNRSLYK
ncbi:DoxX family protein [Cardiobacteriaceae bacterium TAE3-ERU3]|nr:DoxX family protein [Cardiobacteriaceae bacterium TAE3-ERU3]